MAVKEGEERYAMYSRKENGPIYGEGRYSDLYIADHCNTNTNSYSNLGGTYELPESYKYGTDEAQSLLAGSDDFMCDEYEVFMLQ